MVATGPEAAWFCYMVRCSDESLYVEIAINVEDRVKRHNWGVGPKFTALRRPVRLVWKERCGSCEAARRREKEVKGWSRKKKFELARKWDEGKGVVVGPFASLRAAQGKGESSNG